MTSSSDQAPGLAPHPQATKQAWIENPPGQVPIQPVNWSYDVISIQIEGVPTVGLVIFDASGRRVLFAPPEFIMQMSDVLRRGAITTASQLTVPSSGLIVPGGG